MDRIGFSEERDKLHFRLVDFEVLVDYPSGECLLGIWEFGSGSQEEGLNLRSDLEVINM